MPHKGWFTTAERPGDRTLEQQLCGLDGLQHECSGKTVLDVGCAEGLISHYLARFGARSVYGIEIVPGHVDMANRVAAQEKLPCWFQVGDANVYQPGMMFDVVLMLAILHKLRDPSTACARFARQARTLCVVRLPPDAAPLVIDRRSHNQPHDINAVMEREGFRLERVALGTFDEWTGYYGRA